MATIVYLDVDDEITSAAARLRTAGESRVALVLPFGSRLSTSRINFRLLSREAAVNGRRLAVIAPDGATRALAASAGLPSFGSVGEYEQSLETSDGIAGDASGGGGASAGGAGLAAAAGATTEGDVAADVRSGSSTETSAAGTASAAVAHGSGQAAGRPAPTTATTGAGAVPPAEAPSAGATSASAAAATLPGTRSGTSTERLKPVSTHPEAKRPATGSSGRLAGRGVLAAGIGILVLALLVGGVAAYVYLPTATISVSPKVETIGPLSFEVTADPAAAAVDPVAGIIPATLVEVPVSVTGEFPSTGKRVEQSAARGTVRFESINTVGPVAVPEGTRVSTLDGIVFVTTDGVTVPAASVAGERIERGTASVAIRAQRAGPEGNVEAGEITQVPDFLRTQQVSAINPEAMSGGKRDEFPLVEQADVDAALASLRTQLDEQFVAAAADPPEAPEGSKVFPASATLGEPVTTPDPASLVGQEVATFTLGMSATGTVLAVDEAPLEQIADARIAAQVSPDHDLIDGSPTVSQGGGTVTAEGVVTFPVTATASEVAILDPASIEASVLGRPVSEVEAALAPLGAVDVDVWPDFVSTVPTFDERVEVIVSGAGASTPGAPATEPVPSSSMSQPAIAAITRALDQRAQRLRLA